MESFGYCTSSNQTGGTKSPVFLSNLVFLIQYKRVFFFLLPRFGEIFTGYWGSFTRLACFFLSFLFLFPFRFSLCVCRLIWGVVRNTIVVQSCVVAQLAYFFILLTCVCRCRMRVGCFCGITFQILYFRGYFVQQNGGVDFSGLYSLKVGIG